MLATLILLCCLTNNMQVNANIVGVRSPCGKDNTIVEPFIEVYKPNGIKITIPMLDSHMNGFEFHSNINELISIDEDGAFGGEAKFLPSLAQWSLYLKNPKIDIGDRLNYWYEIKINDTGKRYQRRYPFDVQYLIPVRPYSVYFDNPTTETSIDAKIPESEDSVTNNPISCNHHHHKIIELQNEIDELRNEIKLIQSVIKPLIKEVNTIKELFDQDNNSNYDHQLLLTSEKPFPYNNPIEEVRFIVTEKLQLPDFELKILQAKYTKCGILFDMKSEYDKKSLLLRADDKLRNYHIKIVEPTISEKNC